MRKKLVVIGAGPAGHTAAMEAANAGLEVTLIEKNEIGGTCLNRGCVPTKTYLQAIKAEEQAARFKTPVYGIELEEYINNLKDIRDDIISRMNYGSTFAAERRGIRIIEGEAAITNEKTVEVVYNNGQKETIECDFVLIATGSQNRAVSIEDRYNVHSLDEIIMLENLPDEISIIGGGILGVELAVILSKLQINVHLIELKDRILPDWDEEISSQMKFYLEEQYINVITGSSLPKCRDIVLCSGRTPIWPKGAEKYIDNSARTLCIGGDWLYAAGDCISGIKDAAVAISQGKAAVSHMMGKISDLTEVSVPRCIYTPVEAAMAGKTEPELSVESVEYISHFHSAVFTASGMIGGQTQSFIKVLADKNTAKLIGFHMMMPHATELIMICQMAVQSQMTAEQFASLTFPHPTENEQLKEAVLGILEKLNEI